MINEIIDYRNGKYQGFINSNNQRDGLGIFIDDDLTFYISNWNQNKIQGSTIVYISHGKYTYGQWKNNQPHGLNIFRFGQTVLIGNFYQGKPIHKCLIIFQKFNIACILEQNDEQWSIIESGQISSYKTLTSFIGMLEVKVPDYYFSLTKFACRYSNHCQSIKTYECKNNCCYFGYPNGLALIFNSNNALISIGYHQNQQLCQFGGKYEGHRSSQEGNFEVKGQRVTYYSQRPTSKIYQIFQKLHKKGLNFHNEYYDPKIHFFNNIQAFLRDKLQQISNQINNKEYKNISLTNINESLDFQQYNEEQSIKINSIRDKLYSPTNLQQNITLKKNHLHKQLKININQQLPEQTYFKKNDKQNRSSICNPAQTLNRSKSHIKQITPTNICQNNNIVYINKSPFRQRKTKGNNNIDKNNNNEKYQLKQETLPSTKLKQRNNTKYLPIKNQSKQQIKNIMKSNKIYKQNYSSKVHQEPKEEQKIPQKSGQMTMIEKLPTFKGLREEKSSKKINNFVNNKQVQIQIKKDYSKYKDGNNVSPYRNKQYIPQQQSPEIVSYSRQNSRKQPSLNKSTYENIQQRRKRILKEYKGLNNNNQTYNQPYPNNNNIQDKFNKINIGPTLIENNNKKNVVLSKIDDIQKRYGLTNPRKDNPYERKSNQQSTKENGFNFYAYANLQPKQRQINEISTKSKYESKILDKIQNSDNTYSNKSNMSKINVKQPLFNNNQTSQKKNISPLRQKRNYTYLVQ